MGDRAHRAVKYIAAKRPEDDGIGKDRKRKAINFMHPLRRIAGWCARLGADKEIGALANILGPVGADDLVAQIFDALVEHEDEEEEKHDIGHAAHHRGIKLSQPCDGQDIAARGAGSE